MSPARKNTKERADRFGYSLATAFTNVCFLADYCPARTPLELETISKHRTHSA